MKLPEFLQSVIKHKDNSPQLFLTLVLESDYVAGASWYLSANRTTRLTHAVIRKIKNDSWEEKTLAADQVISALEQKTNISPLERVILGMPACYLTDKGDIDQTVKTQIKSLTQKLLLKPIGFVPLHQAIAFKMRQEEGIPPSIILVSETTKYLTISIYKIGKLSLQKIIELSKNIQKIELISEVLKEAKDIEILPSRILLIGIDKISLESLQAECIRYPWTTKIHFLHLPKIDIMPLDAVVKSVSIAGASEISQKDDISIDFDSKVDNEDKQKLERVVQNQSTKAESEIVKKDDISQTNTSLEIESREVVEQAEDNSRFKEDSKEPSPNSERLGNTDEYEDKYERSEYEHELISGSEIDNIESSSKNEHIQTSEPLDITESKNLSQIDEIEEENKLTPKTKSDNIFLVEPETFGFKRDKDILDTKEQLEAYKKRDENKNQSDNQNKILSKPQNEKPKNRTINFSLLSQVKKFHFQSPKFIKSRIVLIAITSLILGVIILGYYLVEYNLPRAKVAIKIVPRTLEENKQFIIDPAATKIETESLIIPGKRIEKIASGEDSYSASGIKKIGDPAKGIVTIYNKSLTSRQFKSGTILVGNSLQFTLDSDVEVASASESIGSITFGKINANITASEIGTQGNLDANTEFIFKNTPSTVAIARNEKVLSGGSSKNITVVSRSDYDALVTKITKKITEEAKTQLESSISGGQILINETINTIVKDKKFDAELGEEIKDFRGNITIVVSGIVIEKSELASIFDPLIIQQAGSGYKVDPQSYIFNISGTKIKKDNTIQTKISAKANAIPDINLTTIPQAISGKNLTETYEYFKNIQGIAETNIYFSYSIQKTVMPKKPENITVVIQP